MTAAVWKMTFEAKVKLIVKLTAQYPILANSDWREESAFDTNHRSKMKPSWVSRDVNKFLSGICLFEGVTIS